MDEVQRQRAAYRRGVLRAAGVAAAIVLVISGLAGFAWVERGKAKNALRLEKIADRERDAALDAAEKASAAEKKKAEEAIASETKAQNALKKAEKALQDKVRADQARGLADLARDRALKEANNKAKEAIASETKAQKHVDTALDYSYDVSQRIWDAATQQANRSPTGNQEVATSKERAGQMEMFRMYSDILGRSTGLAESILKLDPDNFHAKNLKAINLVLAADSLHRQREEARAKKACEAALTYAEELSRDSQHYQTQVIAARTFAWTGGTLFELGDAKRAMLESDRGVAIAREMPKRSDSKDFDYWAWHNLALTFSQAGLIHEKLNNKEVAVQAYLGALQSDTEAAKVDKSYASYRNIMSRWAKLGDIQLSRDENQKALEAYDRSLQLAEYIAQNLKDVQSSRDLWLRYVDRGEAEVALNQQDTALADFTKSLQVADRLPGDDLEDRYKQLVSYERIGNVQLAKGKHEDALQSYTKQLEIASFLATHENTAFRHRSVAISHNKLARAYIAMKKPTEAREQINLRIQVLENLTARDANDVQSWRDLASAYGQLGDFEEEQRNQRAAVNAFRHRVEVLKPLAPEGKAEKYDNAKRDLAVAYGSLAWAEVLNAQFQEAVEAAGQGLKLDPSQDWIKINLAHGYLFTNRVAEAKALYLENKDKMNGRRKLSEDVKEDFKALGDRNLTHPAMPEILQMLGVGS